MMLVSELPAALLVWIVGSVARVGCTRHRLHKPPVRFALSAGRVPLSCRAFESMTGSRSGLPVMGAALDPRVLVTWCATVGTAWHCRLEGAARELLVGARSSGPLWACFTLAGISEKGLLQAVRTAVALDEEGSLPQAPVPDYADENVSTKVVKIIQSYTGVVDKMVWRKQG